MQPQVSALCAPAGLAQAFEQPTLKPLALKCIRAPPQCLITLFDFQKTHDHICVLPKQNTKQCEEEYGTIIDPCLAYEYHHTICRQVISQQMSHLSGEELSPNGVVKSSAEL